MVDLAQRQEMINLLLCSFLAVIAMYVEYQLRTFLVETDPWPDKENAVIILDPIHELVSHDHGAFPEKSINVDFQIRCRRLVEEFFAARIFPHHVE